MTQSFLETVIFFSLLRQPINGRERTPKVKVSNMYTMYRYKTGDSAPHLISSDRKGKEHAAEPREEKKTRHTKPAIMGADPT